MRANYLTDGLYADDIGYGSNNKIPGQKNTNADKLRESYGDSKGEAGPVYTNDLSGKLKRAADYTIGKLKDYFEKEIGIEVDESDFTGVRISFGDPEQYDNKNGNPIGDGLILGLYDPETKEIVINRLYSDELELDGPNDSYFKLPSMERVLAEELVHRLQDKYGSIDQASKKLGPKARGYIEGSAASIAEEALGEHTGIYKEWKEDYRNGIRRRGKRNGFLEPASI